MENPDTFQEEDLRGAAPTLANDLERLGKHSRVRLDVPVFAEVPDPPAEGPGPVLGKLTQRLQPISKRLMPRQRV